MPALAFLHVADAALGRRAALAVSFVLGLAGCATGLPSAATPEAVGLSSERLAAIDAAVRDGIERREIPGAVVLIARRGEVAYFRALGFRDRETGAPMTRDAIFRIASITKPITVAAAMILVEEGRLDLADPVARHLPELAGLQVGSRGRQRLRPRRDGAHRQPGLRGARRLSCAGEARRPTRGEV